MSLEEIKEALSDKSELVAYVEGLQEKANNVDTLKQKVNEYEGKLNDSIQTRDKAKDSLKLVKSTLGLEDINEDTLNSVKGSKNNSKDESLIAEIENLKSQIQTNESNYKESNNALIGQVRDLTVGTELTKKIANSGIIDDGMARADVANAVKANMTYDENNNPIFLNEDGTTRFNNNGSAFGFDDAINEALEARPFLRDTIINNGGQSQGNTGGNPTLKRGEMTASQKGDYIKENGQEAYLKLGA